MALVKQINKKIGFLRFDWSCTDGQIQEGPRRPLMKPHSGLSAVSTFHAFGFDLVPAGLGAVEEKGVCGQGCNGLQAIIVGKLGVKGAQIVGPTIVTGCRKNGYGHRPFLNFAMGFTDVFPSPFEKGAPAGKAKFQGGIECACKASYHASSVSDTTHRAADD